MELNKSKFALALANTLALVYLVCAIFVVLWPGAALQLVGWLAHLVNADKFLTVGVTVGGFIAGLIQVWVYALIVGWIFAWLHNRSIKN